MFILDRLMVSGIRFVIDKVVQVAESELDDTEHLRAELLKAQMDYELGEIDDEQFGEIERRVLARLRELREEEMGLSQGIEGGVSVEVDFEGGHRDDSR